MKLVIKNIVGENKNVIAIKGSGTRFLRIRLISSGWDMANIEPQGFPLVDLDYCKKLRTLPKLSDEEVILCLHERTQHFRW